MTAACEWLTVGMFKSVINGLFDSGVTIVNIHSGQADQAPVVYFDGRQGTAALKSLED